MDWARILAFVTGIVDQELLAGAFVCTWQCAPKARIISGGGIHPESCRLIR